MNKPLDEMNLSELAHLRAVLVDRLEREVIRSRRAGQTWAVIGAQLGCSTSEAHRRFSWIDKLPTADAEGTSGGTTR